MSSIIPTKDEACALNSGVAHLDASRRKLTIYQHIDYSENFFVPASSVAVFGISDMQKLADFIIKYCGMPANGTFEDLITRLNELPRGDEEVSHLEADDILLEALTRVGLEDVAKAYTAARKRCDFWYS